MRPGFADMTTFAGSGGIGICASHLGTWTQQSTLRVQGIPKKSIYIASASGIAIVALGTYSILGDLDP